MFQSYFPEKVYKLERNLGIFIALSQAFMLTVYCVREGGISLGSRTVGYLVCYLTLLIATVIGIPMYTCTIQKMRYRAFRWLRRLYVGLLCSWVMGITFLDQLNGVGLGVYCYLLPTIAAIMIMTPLESIVILGSTWGSLMILLITTGCNSEDLFSNVINSSFVTMVSLIISRRYYRSMAMEFRDRQTIEKQYAKIKESNQLLNKMAYTDQLTGLCNRRYIAEKIYPIFKAYQKQNKFATILMVDIDYFKQYNDSYGHLQGDECLKQVTGVILDYCRGTDIQSVRYGGEEFLMIHVANQIEDITIMAEQIRERILEAGIVRSDIERKLVTVSIGVWAGGLAEVDHIETAIKYADEALYQAKNSGRDCICYY